MPPTSRAPFAEGRYAARAGDFEGIEHCIFDSVAALADSSRNAEAACDTLSALISSFLVTRFKKSRRQLECLTCSIRTLIFLGRMRPLTRLFTMTPTACGVTL